MELDDTGCLADAVSLPPVSCCWKPPLDYLTSLCMLQRLAVSRQALVAAYNVRQHCVTSVSSCLGLGLGAQA